MAKKYKNYYDIIILPPKEVRDYAISLSKTLRKHGSKWVLGRESFIPHISLYHIAVKPGDFGNFIKNLEQSVKGFRAGKLTVEKAKLFEYHLSVSLMTNKPDWIKKFYLKIIKENIKYFDWGRGVENLWRVDKQPQGMRKNLKKYGTPMVGRYFMPHITLTVFKNNKNINKAFNELKFKKFNFKVGSIFVCELGESHSCQKIVKKIKL